MIAKADLAPDQFNITSQKMWLFCLYMFTIGSETFDNGTQSARKAKYKGSDETLAMTASRMIKTDKVKKAKEAIQAGTAVKIEHNRDIAIKLLTDNLSNARIKADNGDIQAVGAITGIIRELNAISNLHRATIVTEGDTKDVVTPAEREALADVRREFKLRVSG